MPWKVYKDGERWCVHKVSASGAKGARVPGGCHGSQAAAEEHMKAMYANSDEEFTVERYEMPSLSNVLFVDLSVGELSLTEGRAFEALAAGTFIDMRGRTVVISKDDLEKFVENTKAALEATRTESGELVGLPIDAKDHDNGDGAGWITDVFLEGDRVKVVPKWTDIGRQLIENGIRRFFSGTLDLANKVLFGGTLTNWPATRNSKGVILLKPIELSLDPGVVALETSLDEEALSVRKAFSDSTMFESWVVEAFDDHLIVQDGENKFFNVPYKKRRKDGKFEYEFATREDWKEVKHAWVEAALNRVKKIVSTLASKPQGEEPETVEKENEMPKLKLEDLSEEERTALMTDVVEQLQKADGLPAEVQTRLSAAFQNVALRDVFNLEDASAELAKQMKEALMAEYQHLQEESGKQIAMLIADIRRKDKVANLSRSLTDGKASDAKRGLPVSTAKLQEFLLGLSPAQQASAEEILTAIVRDGLVDFAEHGVDGKNEPKTDLPEEITAALKDGRLTVADLDDATLGLGDLSRYDLSAYK